MNKRSDKGFTLVEVVVTAVLLSLLALGAFSMYMMYANETRATAANLKMQRQSEGFMDELSRKVREAEIIYAFGETALPSDPSDEVDEVKAITVIENIINYSNVSGVPSTITEKKVSYRFGEIDGKGILETWGPDDNDWKPFTIDGDTIWVRLADSKFLLDDDRRYVGVEMALTRKINSGEEFSLTIQRGIFKCRLL